MPWDEPWVRNTFIIKTDSLKIEMQYPKLESSSRTKVKIDLEIRYLIAKLSISCLCFTNCLGKKIQIWTKNLMAFYRSVRSRQLNVGDLQDLGNQLICLANNYNWSFKCKWMQHKDGKLWNEFVKNKVEDTRIRVNFVKIGQYVKKDAWLKKEKRG